MDHNNEITCVKVARIIAEPPYAPVSAWEFNALQTEEVFQERLRGSTIYIIGQRPFLWFDNVVIGESAISFEITDGQLPPVQCRIQPYRIGLCLPDEVLDVALGFHREPQTNTPPMRNVAAIRMYDSGGGFKVWWSPQKFLFEVLIRNLPADIDGDFSGYLDFKVHYIGKAFSQTVWDRLRKHENYQNILIREDVLGLGHSRPALEITLFALNIIGLDERCFKLALKDLEENPPAKLHRFRPEPNDPRFVEFVRPWVEPSDAAVTTELEALLVSRFKPEYNTIRYENYPNIIGGLRDAGYTDTELDLENFPFRLLTSDGVEPLTDDD